MLKVKNLRLKYPSADYKIFDGIDVEIKDKEKVLLLGPSGSGKSTLLNVLSGIVPNLIDLPMKYDALEIAENSGVIFQDPDSQFCMPQVNEELAFILENQQIPRHDMDSRIHEALNHVGLDVNPKQRIHQLSGGMKQKLAIAGTLLQGADTLFLDEPTAMLDVEATENLWNLLKDLWEDKTVLIVEHKVEHIWQHVDRVILMNHHGHIIQQGTPEYIMAHYESLLSEYGVWHPKAWSHAPMPQHPVQSTAQNFYFSFEQGAIQRGRRTLYEVDALHIEPGEWITLTGKNGSGKTSLLESMMQLIRYKGNMHYGGQKLTKIKDAAQHMFLVYQNPELQFIQNSVFDEIWVNYHHMDPEHAKAKTAEMLALLDLEHVSSQHPFELSMGQKRRLSVATALSTKADIILLDEPTFGLDSHNTFKLIELFQSRIAQGQTILMVTHDAHIIERYPTRRIEVKEGKLYEVEEVRT
ncbi:ABC transporter ATP-binding protein [Staphylococcus pseudintermedius]|uniref:ABC transporter ATP-binding protein n=1 Tax=Staphylococcus pseudintermedius TaxID=283734 RepID=UPI0018F397FE|nr:ABC transporter ATP-binding protein [Staphylococcus pseudintermedius]EGQ1306463.1 ATP-binding cassette domain-containing protein [Staphylococcus pseudintermedius]EGQ2692195.1 ABC transporter ATP-binding protein [Staphylococcus pseudintermedius]EGQ3255451.1 ABC transporter ATP-binding protein [Staphylococcus pseudintermedius]EGQ3539392.1 ABC transporter ATP-binding protein [Staphylococcus pseudintermedius]EGQ3608000.1 ABC transporter ATP-binding protein [Staphylococcus pseudintermedius]